MTRERFVQLVSEAMDGLPAEFRRRMQNLAVLVEDFPAPPPRRRNRPHSPPRRPGLLLGVFVGVPATQRSVFNLPTGPDHIVLYQKNIEAICRSDEEIREQVRITLLHEVGHYFGMSEDELRHL